MRYVVRLPFKSGLPDISNSLSKASILYRKQEERLSSKPVIRDGYHDRGIGL